jgi:hypothetical protein
MNALDAHWVQHEAWLAAGLEPKTEPNAGAF